MFVTLPIFQNLLNYTYSLKKPADGSWGVSKSKGRSTGMIGELQRKEVDIGMYADFAVHIPTYYNFV